MVAGHLQEKSKKYYMVLNYVDVYGKRHTKWISTGLPVKGNKKQAEDMLMKLRREFHPPELLADQYGDLTSPDMAFTQYLRMWLTIAEPTVQQTTYASYANIIEHVLIPYFEPLCLKLSEVQAHHIQRFYLLKLKKVKPNSVIHYHAVLHRALKYAVKIDLIPTNPADKVDRPKKNDFQGSFYSETELRQLFEAAQGTKLELPIFLAAFYGLRRSEVLGLKWSAIDFEQNTISIQHTLLTCKIDGKQVSIAEDTTKTKSSRRTLPLVPQFRAYLLKKRREQEEYRRICGNCYNKAYLDYICVDQLGNIIKPDYVTAAFKKLLERNGLRPIRFHDLRHTCASLMLKNGVPLKQIQEWLGHSDFSTTADIYAHLDSQSKLSSAQSMSEGIHEALALIG